MITAEMISSKILDYLNGRVDLKSLVSWSHDALILVSESEQDLENESAILHVLGYLAATDHENFPLTWEVLSGLLGQLGVKSVRVEIS